MAKLLLALLGVAASAMALAEDWPQWRGSDRDGIWHEEGILKSFPPGGLQVRWRVPVGTGYSSPCIVAGRAYLTDSEVTRTSSRENVRCFEVATGKPIWKQSYDVIYPEWGANPDHPFGPAATPVVAGGKVYTVGRMFNVLCLDAGDGRVLWHNDLPKQYKTTEDLRGFSSSPLIEGNLLVIAIAKSAQASIVAFDKETGRQVWESLDEIPSNSSPIVITAGGRRQIIVWAYRSVAALDPETGQILWRMPVNSGQSYTVATPIQRGDLLLIGGLMLKLAAEKPGAAVLWPEDMRPSRINLSETSTPLFLDDLVVSPASQGQLRCFDGGTGEQRWQADEVTELNGGASIHMTAAPGIDRVFLFTDRGDLILARLSSTGYKEISRAHLLDPTNDFGDRKMAWSPPSYAERCVFARSDKELVCASLATGE